MKRLFKILVILTLVLVSCSTQQNLTTSTEVLGSGIKYDLLIENAKLYQLDSLIKADTLPMLNVWYEGTFIDYNTNNSITKRVFIKKYGKTKITYVVTGNKEPFFIEKRIKTRK